MNVDIGQSDSGFPFKLGCNYRQELGKTRILCSSLAANDEHSRSGHGKRVVVLAQLAVMSALVAVLTVIALPMPPPLSTLTLAPAAIFVISVFLGPRIGFVSAAIGSAIGFTFGAIVGTVAGAAPGSSLYPVFLIGIIVARGPEGYIVGSLRKTNELLAMVIGTIYETVAFFVIDFFYTYPILLGLSSAWAYLDFGTMIDLVWIIPAIIVLRYLRKQLGMKYFDEGTVHSSS
jgi:uncharacterized membrane protein